MRNMMGMAGGVAVAEESKVEVGRVPERLKVMTEREIEGLWQRTLAGPDKLVSTVGMAEELERLDSGLKFYFLERGQHQTPDELVRPSMEKTVKDSFMYQEWKRVIEMRFSRQDLEFIKQADDLMRGTVSSDGEQLVGNFYLATQRVQKGQLESPLMALDEAQIESEMGHRGLVDEMALKQYEEGRAGAGTLMAALWHDAAKLQPPGEVGQRGKMRMLSHEIAGAIRGRAVSKAFYEAVGFSAQQADLLSRWVEFQIAQHGFAEFPMNFAVANGELVESLGKLGHGGREVERGIFAVAGYWGYEVYGVVRNEEAMAGMTEDQVKEVELVRAIDMLTGVMDYSFPKYVLGTSEEMLEGYGTMGDLFVKSFGRTFGLNLKDGGLEKYPDLMKNEAQRVFRSAMLLAVCSIDLNDPESRDILGGLDFSAGERMRNRLASDVFEKRLKVLGSKFDEWKKDGKERSEFAGEVNEAVVEIASVFGNVWGSAENMAKACQFVERALERNVVLSGATGKDGDVYTKFDAVHLKTAVEKFVFPAVGYKV